MIEELYIDPKVMKQLDELRRCGKKAALAAERASAIIAGLKARGRMPDRAATPTRHGELRIRGVRKYSLGSGYRLITYRQRRRFYLLYADSHDGCDRWLENNRELPLDLIELRCQRHRVPVTAHRDIPARHRPAPGEESDDSLIPIDESDLRKIFCGLTGESV